MRRILVTGAARIIIRGRRLGGVVGAKALLRGPGFQQGAVDREVLVRQQFLFADLLHHGTEERLRDVAFQQPVAILGERRGGTPATNFVRSLRDCPESYHLIGVDCDKYYLRRAETDERYLVPLARDPDYQRVLMDIISESGADLVYAQTDQEISEISTWRDQCGARTLMPDAETVAICQDKFRSFEKWKQAGLRVPETMMIETPGDLSAAFERFGCPVWLRAVVSPGGGQGSFRAKNVETGKAWMDFCEGWGRFTAAQCLEPDSTTWTSLWKNGELVVAQGRKRLYWEFGNRAPSGVTGITGTGVTVSDPVLDRVAAEAVHAVDSRPNGIFSVDLTYDRDGELNLTEINIGRFFTTHYFFTKAGLNLPYLFVKCAFDEELPAFGPKINPLPKNLAWVRGMDFHPVLTTVEEIDHAESELAVRRERLTVGVAGDGNGL